jgi:hypothetical protein
MKLAYLAAALFALVALTESALGLYGPRSVAGDADWEAAAKHVREGLQEGDLIVFAPAWVDQVGRQHLGDKMPISMVARADAAPYARIWELSIRGGRAEETKALAAKEEARFGRVTVRRYEQPAAKILYDFTAHVADGHASPGTRVDQRVMEIDYQPRRGLLTPIVAGQTNEIVYEDVPGGGTLVGYVGLHDYYARKSADGVVLFRAQVDDTSAVTLPVRNQDGWKRFEMPLPEGKHKVRFSLSAEQPAWRLPGFHAEVRAP